MTSPLYLAADEPLIHLLERQREDLLDINHHDFGADGQSHTTTATRGRADGRALLAANRAGKVWVNLRCCEGAHRGLWAKIERSLRELGAQLGVQLGVQGAGGLTGQLTLSSPASQLPLRFEPSGVTLFRMPGVRRGKVYPASEAFMPRMLMEDARAC